MADIVTYAQNREDLYIASFFPDVENGFYVDVGAHHPVRDSVTKYFSLHGWTGINIEPQRKYHELLAADRGKDVNLNIGISDAAGSLRLREFPGDGLSTFSEVMKSEYEQDQHMRSAGHIDYDVKVDTLANVLSEHVPAGRTVHFLKVDVEGLEYQVFRGNDWSLFRPILLCVEANHIVQDWHQLLTDANYEKVLFDGLNEYFLAKEHKARVKLFAFATMFLVDKQIKPFFLSSHIEDLHGQIHHLLTEAAELDARHNDALTSQANAHNDALTRQADTHNDALTRQADTHNDALTRQADALTRQADALTRQADALTRQADAHTEALTSQAEAHSDALARLAGENASLEEKAQRWEEKVAKLHASSKSVKYHLRSLYELVRERVARRFDRHGSDLQPPGLGEGSRDGSYSDRSDFARFPERGLNAQHASQLTEANRESLYWRSAAIRSWGSAMVGHEDEVEALRKAISVMTGTVSWRVTAPLRKVRNVQRAVARRARG